MKTLRIKNYWILVFIFVALILVATSIVLVPAGHVGVVTRFGAVNRVAQPGISFKIPIIEGVVIMDVRTQIYQVDTTAASQDLQTVSSTIAVNYHLDGRYAVQVYQNVGTDYSDVLIAPAIQNIFKATTAEYTAEQLITERETVRGNAETALRAQLAVYHVVVDNFNIVHFDFSSQFDAAIEAKQVAEQNVETSKQLLAKAEVDAQTAVAQAQGQADAQKALRDAGALTPAYLEYLALTKWNGILPNVVGGATPFIDINGLTSNSTQGQTTP